MTSQSPTSLLADKRGLLGRAGDQKGGQWPEGSPGGERLEAAASAAAGDPVLLPKARSLTKADELAKWACELTA